MTTRKPVEGQKAGSKQKQPFRAKVTATTVMKAAILYGLTVGEARLFGTAPTEVDVLSRIYLDGTPIMDVNGTKLLDAEVEWRNGTIDQTVIEGMPSVSLPQDISAEVKYGVPLSRTMVTRDVTAYDIMLNIPQLYRGDAEGNSYAGTVAIKVEADNGDGIFVDFGTHTFEEKVINGFNPVITINVPKADSHTIRVTKLTPDATDEFSANAVAVYTITEIIEVRMAYPCTALLFVKYDAEQFSSIPKLEVRFFGVSDLLIPANYYPDDNRTYATRGAGTTNGVWDGTWKKGYSDNPIWHWLALATNKQWGIGNRIDISMIDKWELYRLAKYCDQLVPDGKGGQEPRFTCNNLYLNTAEDAYKVFKDLSSLIRGATIYDGQFLRPRIDTPRDAVHIFSQANVKDLRYSTVEDGAAHNVVHVQYYDKENRFATKVVTRRDKDDIRDRGSYFPLELAAFGVSSEGQAQRAAEYILASELTETEMIAFTTGLEGITPLVGDVFLFADNYTAGKAISGRIKAINGTQVTLDRLIDPDNVNGSFIVNTTNNAVATRKIVAINGAVITLDSALDSYSHPFLVWAIISETLGIPEFYIIESKYNAEDSTWSISGLQYSRKKYNKIDLASRIESPPFTSIVPNGISAPALLTLSYTSRIAQDMNVYSITAAWSDVTGASAYSLDMRKDGDTWVNLGRIYALTFDVDNVYEGIYEFRVRAVDVLGNYSPYTLSQPLQMRGKVLPPPVLDNYVVTGVLFGFKHSWVFPAHTEDSRGVRLRFSATDPSGSIQPLVTEIDKAYPATTHEDIGVPSGTTRWFSAAIVDKYGIVGQYTNWFSAATSDDPDEILELIKGHVGIEAIDAELAAEIQTAKGNAAEALNAANQVRDETRDAVNELVTDINTERDGRIAAVSQLQDGVTNAQTTADNATTSLNNYKSSTDTTLSNQQTQIKVAADTANSAVFLANTLDSRVNDVDQKAASALTKSETNATAISAQATSLAALNASIGTSVLSTSPDSSKPNLFAAIAVKVPSEVANYTIPDYTHIATYPVVSQSYVGKEGLFGTSGNTNTIGFFRCVLNTAQAKTITISNLYGDDAHAVYLNNKLIYSRGSVGGGANVQLNLLVGSNILDLAYNNGGGEWGLRYDNEISTQVDSIYAASILAINKADTTYVNSVKSTADAADGKANANTTAIQGLQARVGNNESTINSIQQTKANKDEVASIAQTALQSTWQNDAQAKVDALQIGGINLLLNTELPQASKPVKIISGAEFSVVQGLIATFDQGVNASGIAESYYTPTSDSIGERFIRCNVGSSIESMRGKTYTISAGFRGSSQVKWRIISYGAAGWVDVANVPCYVVNDIVQRTSATFTVPNDATDFILSIQFISNTPNAPAIAVSQMQLQLGNKATSWSKSPKDIDNDLTSFQSTVTNTYQTKSDATQTTANLTQQIDSKASVSQANEAATNAVNNLQIGGRNYYIDATTAIELYTGANSLQKYTGGFSVVGVGANNAQVRLTPVIDSNGWWTVSFYHRAGSGGYTLSIDICDLGHKQFTFASNTWQYFSLSVNVTNFDIDHKFVDIEGLTGQLHEFKSVKVEKGNKATDWTPAPEDANKALTDFQANVINNYSTKADTNSAIASGIQQYDASMSTSLPTESDPNRGNQWLATVVALEGRGGWNINTIPDYSWLRKASVSSREYVLDDATMKYGVWQNSIVCFRAVVWCNTERTINLGNFTGDDAHAIYVNQTKVFSWAANATNQVSFVVPAGTSIIDIIVINGIGGVGFTAQNRLSDQVNWMRAPKSTELQASANASAISQTQVEVTNINGQVSSLASQTNTLTSTVNKLAVAGANLLRNSDFALGNTNYWGVDTYNEQDDVAVNGLVGSEWLVQAGDSKTLIVHQTANYGGTQFVEVKQDVPVEGGKIYQISAYTGSHRAATSIFAYFFDSAGNNTGNTYLQQPATDTNNNEKTGGTKLAGYKRIYQNVTVPTDCTRIQIVIRRRESTSDPYLMMTRAMVCEVSSAGASLVGWSESSTGNTVTLQQQAQTIDGIQAKWTVKINNNGYAAGFGLISTPNNGAIVSAFMVDADAFVVGKAGTNIKPIVSVSGGQTVEGIYYPESGTYLNTAWISKASIGTAHINDLAVTTAKIGDSQITTAKIANASITTAKIGVAEIDTLRIQGRAVTVPYYYTDTNPVFINSRFGDFPVSSNGSRIVPVVSAFSAYGFTPYAEVFVVCDVGILMSGLYDSAKGEAVSVRLIQGYYDTASGNPPNAKRIDRADTITYYDDPSSPNIGTRWEVTNKSCGAFSRKMTADAYGNIALSLWVSSEGSVRNSTRLIVEPKTEITWYVQELKR